MIRIKPRWKKTRIFFAALLGLFFVALLGNNPGKAAEPIRMKYSTFIGPAHPYAPVITAYLKELQAASKGTVIIDIHGAESLGKAAEHYDLVVEGLADIGSVSAAYTPARFPLSSFGDLPFFSTSARASQDVIEALIQKKLITKEFEEVKLLFPTMSAPSQVFSNKPLNKVEDFKGLRVTCVGSIYNRTMAVLGAQCVTMGYPDVYLALERGTLDAAFIGWAGCKGYRLYEVAKYPVDIGFMGGFFNSLVMNKKSWSKLSPEVQAAWNKISEKYGMLGAAAIDEADEASTKVWADVNKKIVKFPAAEREKLARLAIPIWQDWIDRMEKAGKPGKEIYRTYLKVMQEKGHPVVVKIPGI
jgi:TRAP-type transport system periplasmic protein